jgi:hypothetical protein
LRVLSTAVSQKYRGRRRAIDGESCRCLTPRQHYLICIAGFRPHCLLTSLRARHRDGYRKRHLVHGDGLQIGRRFSQSELGEARGETVRIFHSHEQMRRRGGGGATEHIDHGQEHQRPAPSGRSNRAVAKSSSAAKQAHSRDYVAPSVSHYCLAHQIRANMAARINRVHWYRQWTSKERSR